MAGDGVPNFTIEQHFNRLTPAEAERLAKLAEECAETIQIICKIQRHGYASRNPDAGASRLTNREELEQELGDIAAALRLMFEAGDLREARFAAAAKAGLQRMRPYMHHQGTGGERCD